MKKKIFGGIAVLSIAAAMTFNVSMNTQSNGLSNVALVNVEVLAFGEPNDQSKKDCYETVNYNSTLGDSYVSTKKYCGADCRSVKAHKWSGECK